MTRLTKENIRSIEATSHEWNRYLKTHTGLAYIDIASKVSGKSVAEIEKAAEEYTIRVVPITTGLGVIDFFSDSITAIIKTMDFSVKVTNNSDVDGLYEACKDEADIVFMADDNRYIALNLKNGRIGENDYATANGYIEILESCVNTEIDRKKIGTQTEQSQSRPSIAQRNRLLASQQGRPIQQEMLPYPVLVLGYGPVGKEMAVALKKKSALVTVYDKDPGKLITAKKHGLKTIEFDSEIKNFKLIADATNEGGWLGKDMLDDEALIVAPGIPLSLDKQAQRKFTGRFIHDNLEIGTVSMLGLAL